LFGVLSRKDGEELGAYGREALKSITGNEGKLDFAKCEVL